MSKSLKTTIKYVGEEMRPSRFMIDLLHVPEKKETAPKNNKTKKILAAIKNTHLKPEECLKRITFFPLFKAVFVLLSKTVVLFFRLSRIIIVFFALFGRIAAFVFRLLYPRHGSSGSILRELEASLASEHDEREVKNLKFSSFRLRPIVAFVLLLMVIIAPFKAFSVYQEALNLKNRVMDASAAALDDIKSASVSATGMNFDLAGADFSAASRNFLAAQSEIGEISGLLNILSVIAPQGEIKLAASADTILEAGRLVAEIGSELSAVLSAINQENTDIKTILDKFEAIREKLTADAFQLDSALAKIDSAVLPEEYREKFVIVQEHAGFIHESLVEFGNVVKLARSFLGFSQDKRYLLVFQNNTEMRGSGGFAGSFAIIDFRNGAIQKLHIPPGGSYDTEGGLLERIVAPEPLWLLNPLWHFWDANWWPDWPTSASKLAWFYEKSNGSTVDGVISFTPSVLEDILKVTGPIDLREKYGVVIDGKNAWDVLQTIAEQKPEDHPDYKKYRDLREDLLAEFETSTAFMKEEIATATAETLCQSVSTETATSACPVITQSGNEPKKIIGDLMEALITRLKSGMDKERFLAMAQVLLENLDKKQIMFYFTDEELQSKADEYDWTGRIKDTSWDYLMIAHSNIAGAKTDKVMEENIDLKTDVAADGTITNVLEITRRHKGRPGEAFTGARNVDWLRVYVPSGSRLVSASGFSAPDAKFFEKPDENWKQDAYLAETEGRAEIDESSGTKIYFEKNKTVFANWAMVDPGNTAVIRLKYILPFKLAALDKENDWKNRIANLMNPAQKELLPYALLVQKQPGAVGAEFTSHVQLSDNFQIVWRYDNGQVVNDALPDSVWQVSERLQSDMYRAILAVQ